MKCVLSCSKFPVVLVAMLGSTIPVSIIGTMFAMSVSPFWTPNQFSKIDIPAGFIFYLELICFSPCSWHALLPMRSNNIGDR